MANYRSEFCGIDGRQYKIEIVTNSADTSYQTLTLAGGSSCILEYENSQTPFDPIRTSTLSMTFVHDKYLDDLLLPHADDVQVKLFSKYANSWKTHPEFVGYLNQAGSQNAGYVNCLEDVTLTANDLLLTAQFKKYINKSGTSKKQVVKVHDILSKLFDIFPGLNIIKWPKTKMTSDFKLLSPENLYISENNFYSSDTDNGWDYQHVIESVAKYFGYTAFMFEDMLYFMDYLNLARCSENIYNSVQYSTTCFSLERGDTYWSPSGNWDSRPFRKITKNSYRGSSNQISFFPIYNKIKVVDNFYEVDELIPNPLGDNNVTNEYGTESACEFNRKRNKPCTFINKDGDKESDAGENYLYYKREFKNKYYDSHFYSGNTELTYDQVLDIPDYDVNDWYEWFQGTSITLYGWEASFWNATPGGITLSFAIDGQFDSVLVRWNGKYQYDAYRNLVPSLSMFVGGSTYDALTPNDFDYQWHEYNSGGYHFYYGISNNYFYFIPVPEPLTALAPWTYYGYILTDENGIVEDRMPITSYPPMCTYGATSIVVPGSDTVWFAYLSLTIDNACNPNPKDYEVKFTYGYETTAQTVVSRSLTLQPHTSETLELYAYPNVSVYGGTNAWEIDVNGYKQRFTRKDTANPTFPDRTNPMRILRGAKVMELANFNIDDYRAETPSDISFSRYLAIAQQGGTTGTTATTLMDRYKTVYSLNENTAPAVMVDGKTGIIIDADATFTRYMAADYINPEWKTEASKNITINPALVFTLGIGNKFWNGSSWVTGETAFAVPLQWKTAADVDDDPDNDSPSPWNSSLHIRNQISWETWTGQGGYFIPLGGVDFNGSVTFKIRMPREVQDKGSIEDGFNGMCWINKLDLSIGTKGSALDDLNDIVFENVIDEKAVNEFSPIELDITSYPEKCKMSYSHIGYNGKLIPKMRDLVLYGEDQAEESNIIERYVHQFCTKTCVKDLDLKLGKWIDYSSQADDKSEFTPFYGVIDTYDDNDEYKVYVNLGQRKDYYLAVDSVHLMELKKYYDYPESNRIKMKFNSNNFPEQLWNTDYGGNNLVDTIVTQDGNNYIVEYVYSGPINNVRISNISGNTSLTDVWLPPTIGTIYNYNYVWARSFSGCSNLNHIVISQTPAAPITDNFEGVASSGYLEVPAGVDYSTWYSKLPDDWSGIVWVDSPDIAVGTVVTTATRDFNYVGSSASNLRATCDKSWCTVTIRDNGSNSYSLIATISENKTLDTRTAKITVTDGTKTKYVNVSQSHADMIFTSSPMPDSGTTIGFKPDGTPKATSSTGLLLNITYNGDKNDITFNKPDWVNCQWQGSDWVIDSDGLLNRQLLINCSSGAYVSRSGYTSVIATHGNETKEIKMKIAQDGEAKIKWTCWYYMNNRWNVASWNSTLTAATIPTGSTYVTVRATLDYDGISDYASGSNLNCIITNAKTFWSAAPTSPIKFQLQPDWESGGWPGHAFVPDFNKTVSSYYWEWFTYPLYGGASHCSWPASDDNPYGADYNLFKGTGASNKVTLRVYSENESIVLTNTTITIQKG